MNTRHFKAPHMHGSYLVIELTNICNLNCVHCAVSEKDHPHHATTGAMSTENIRRLLLDLIEVHARFDTLILFWLGEPLLHPNFIEIYQAALRGAVTHDLFGNIEVHSNAALLTPQIRDALLNSAPVSQRLHITIDANSKETYQKIKGRDQLLLVEKNAKAFIKSKYEQDAKWPRPIIQYILGENNAHEAKDFRQKWISVFDAIGQKPRVVAGHVPPGEDPILFFRLLDCPTEQDQARNNAIFQEKMTEMGISAPHPEQPQACETKPCSGFWKSPVLNWNGELTACTRDNALENSLGNISTAPFSSLWWGKQMTSRRQKVANANYDGLKLCQDCFIPTSLNHTNISNEEIIQHQTEMGQYP